MLVMMNGKYMYKGDDIDNFIADADPLTAWQSIVSGTIVNIETGTTSTEREYLAFSLEGHQRPAKTLVVTAVIATYGKEAAKTKLLSGFDYNDLLGAKFDREKRKTTIKLRGSKIEKAIKSLEGLSFAELKALAIEKGLKPARSKAQLLAQLA